MIKCQQQCIFKIRDKIPGHGPQKVLRKFRHHGGREYVRLECGCTLPVTWLPMAEQEVIRELVAVPPPLTPQHLWEWANMVLKRLCDFYKREGVGLI